MLGTYLTLFVLVALFRLLSVGVAAPVESLVVAVGVDGEGADHHFAVVDVDEFADGNDPDSCSGPSAADLDEFAGVAEVPRRPDSTKD